MLKAVTGSTRNGIGGQGGAFIREIGDSIIANGVNDSLTGTDGNGGYYHQRNDIAWALALTGWPMVYQVYYYGILISPFLGSNSGVGGDRTDDLLGRIENDLLQFPTDVCRISIGTNDLSGSIELATIKDNIKSLVLRASANSQNIWLDTVLPRVAPGALSVDNEANRVALNIYIRELASQFPNVTLLDGDAALGDGAGGIAEADYLIDGIHPTPIGSYTRAVKTIVPVLRKMIASSVLERSVPEYYDVSDAPYGNLLINSAFTGTGGTASTNVTGTLPDDWRAECAGGTDLTSVASIVSQADWNGDTANYIQHVATTTGGGVIDEYVRTRVSATVTTGIVAGAWYEGEVEIIVDANSGTNVTRAIWLDCRDTTGDQTKVQFHNQGYSSGGNDTLYPEDAIRLIAKTPPFIADGTTGMLFYINLGMDASVAGTRTMRIGAPSLKRIQDPTAVILGKSYSVRKKNQTADFTVDVPPRFIVKSVSIANNSANAVTGGIKIGTTDGGTEVLTTVAVGANEMVAVDAADLTLSAFSTLTLQTLYIQDVTAWNSADLDVTVNLEAC